MSEFRQPPRMTLPRNGAIDPRWIGGLAPLVLLAAGLARGVYTVGPESVGVPWATSVGAQPCELSLAVQ